ncbi:hypothetical protein C5B96_15620 [Subtercola sp. Z020]|uniref:hypothetical protein n=1 Tax=Subtercola sp. Z020 TaxID=2080582 RepID=UPI000CE8D2D8|nr:hypothetical protein [Subtercola sp. Z020]PPF77550.1 hypothetical protein C5B96_15620 [Subtercola sp. Z020]
MRRDLILIDSEIHQLAQGADLEAIKTQALQAVHDGGGLLDLVVVGNKSVTALVSPGVSVQFESIQVPRDDRDDGDLDAPYDVDYSESMY